MAIGANGWQTVNWIRWKDSGLNNGHLMKAASCSLHSRTGMKWWREAFCLGRRTQSRPIVLVWLHAIHKMRSTTKTVAIPRTAFVRRRAPIPPGLWFACAQIGFPSHGLDECHLPGNYTWWKHANALNYSPKTRIAWWLTRKRKMNSCSRCKPWAIAFPTCLSWSIKIVKCLLENIAIPFKSVGKIFWCGFEIVRAVYGCLRMLSQLNHGWRYFQVLHTN